MKDLVIDAGFPGGNIVFEEFEGDTVYLHQDLRDTEGDWFYWHFRVRGAAGRTLTFQFTGSNVIGVRGPAVSTDGGETWAWLGLRAVKGQSFTYSFPADSGEVRFCFAMPYLEANLRRFLARHAGDPHLKADVLCTSRRGRQVELLHVGQLNNSPDCRVLLTARHHCCETMADYALEGLLDAVLGGSDGGQWLREHVEFLVVPFADKDGVEDGDQGKNRKPHDHNRDYAGESLYPEVKALRGLVPRWSEGKLRVALDLHCPHIRGAHNEVLYFVGGPDQDVWTQVGRLSEILERSQTGTLRYEAEDNLPFGQAWNTGKNYEAGRSCGRWAAEQPGILIGSGIEIPYANVKGQPVTAATAREFGRDLARAMQQYLREVP
jgi:hypothetical protein